MKINPESTIYFLHQIKKQAENGNYLVKMRCAEKNIPLQIFPEVFPPQQDFLMGNYLKKISNIQEMEIADMGTGSGVEAISAALLGAKHIDAVDINPSAIQCAEKNSHLNHACDRISFFLSNLFSNIKNNKKYNLILANLPFIDFDGGKELIDLALYDNHHAIHKEFLQQAHKHLADGGKILLPHANLQSGITSQPNLDFAKLENMIFASGFALKIVSQKPFREDYLWRLYELRIIK
ncbi:MAG: 50S ribosomal protein L11 methyltransferase [Parcubacteria group bacterium]|jgi:methylase of polypeptide subunit release factors